ncbi:acyl-CoA thioesterase [Yinghuangia aomiensis]
MSLRDPWSDLLACLNLAPAAPAGPTDGRAVWTGVNQQLGYHRLFGGQLLAQTVRAAGLTVPGKSVKSLHVLFARPGDTAEPVRYEVERHHEGSTFASVSVTARQSHGAVATATVSLHVPEAGPDRQSTDPVPAVPGPERRVELEPIPWETRSTLDLDTVKTEEPEYAFWMRTPPADPALAQALTAYATDLTPIGTALRPFEAVTQHDAGTVFTSAVTAHSVWFHRAFRTDDAWLFVRQHSPLVAHGRCFGRGDVLAEDGSLVASFAQEALLRFTA